MSVVPSESPGREQIVDADVAEAQRLAEAARVAAERVRSEALARAKDYTDHAVEEASNATRSARVDALARLSANGGSGAESTDTQAQAQADLELAELRAIRRARRAREEAYARARRETEVADRAALEAAQRAASLVASRPTPVLPDGRSYPTAEYRPSLVIDPTDLPPTRPEPVLPGPIPSRGPVLEHTPADTSGGIHDVACRDCGAYSDPSRFFCRRCGRDLVAPPAAVALRWWPRLLARLTGRRQDLGRLPGDNPEPVDRTGAGHRSPSDVKNALERARRGPRALSSSALRGPRWMDRIGASPGRTLTVGKGMVAVVVLGLVSLAFAHYGGGGTSGLLEKIAPKPAYILGITANDGACSHLVDQTNGATFTKTGQPPNPADAVCRFTLPVDLDLDAVAIIHPAYPLDPRVVQLVALGAKGPSTRTIDLNQTVKQQSFHWKVSGVKAVYLYVQAPAAYSISQIEFFQPS